MDDPSGHNISALFTNFQSSATKLYSGLSSTISNAVNNIGRTTTSFISDQIQKATENSYYSDCSFVDEEIKWYDYVTSGLIGLGVGFAQNTLSGFMMPICMTNDYLFGTNTASDFQQILKEQEYYIKSDYVKDETWYYGGKIAGDVGSLAFGAYQTFLGFSLLSESAPITGAGLLALVSGEGALVSAGLLAVSVPLTAASVAVTSVGVSTMAYSVNNAGNDVGSFVDSLNKDKSKKIDDLISEIPKKYKDINQCDKFAQALADKLDANNIEYEIIRVESEYGIYSDKAEEVIGDGYHYGIKVGNTIYDNMTPNGMDYDDWRADLGLTSQPKNIIRERKVSDITNK